MSIACRRRLWGGPLRVIHLTRDVRSWVHSESRRPGVERNGRRPRGGLAFGMLRWWRVNRRLDQRLAASGHPRVSAGLV